MPFEYIDHTADVAVRLVASDLESLLGEATRALGDIFVETPLTSSAALRQSVPLEIESEDREALLVDYLNELIFLFDTQRLLPAGLDVTRLSEGSSVYLEGVVKGETYDDRRHALKTEVKAATFHGLTIREESGGLQAEVVFDL